jgi:signal transduction histidine kinase/DNA-binding response OmpR family regulator
MNLATGDANWRAHSGKRVLITDDEPLIRRALADYLEEWGYDVVAASDGAEGLELTRTERFDVALVDLRMPRVDGLQMIATLKLERPTLPVVVISGTGVLSDAIEAIRLGAWDYITKPVHDMDEIAVVIQRVLDRAELVAERDRYQNEIEQLNRSLEVEVSRQTEDLRAQNRRLTALDRVSNAISTPLDMESMLGRAIDAAMEAIGADGGIVRLLNPAVDQLVVAAVRGLPQSYVESVRAVPFGEGIVGRVAQNGHPAVDVNIEDDPWLSQLAPGGSALADGDQGFVSLLYVPLRAGSQASAKQSIKGTLGVMMHDPCDFGPAEIQLLASIGNQIGVAVARAQYASDLERTNVELERANLELRRLDLLREQFIQNVAHELRTPLALVFGYVKMLEKRRLSSEEHERAVNVTAKYVQVLVDLVESITTLQDLGSQPLEIELVRPAELARTALRMSRQDAVAAGVKLREEFSPDLPAFPGDFTRLAQALHQLLDNACKFSHDGGEVVLSARAADDVIYISIADQGIGIPPEEHERIFERFYQVDGSATRRYGGTGLGLALVKEIVTAHNGSVEVQSEPGTGSTFTVCLPLTHVER